MKDVSLARALRLGRAFLFAFIAAMISVASTALGQPVFSNYTVIGSNLQMTILGEVGFTNQILTSTDLIAGHWTVMSNIVVSQNPYVFSDTINPAGSQLFYRVADPNWITNPPSMALIPPGTFEMGDTFNEGQYYELPVHPVFVSAFYMDKCEVTLALWSQVVGWSITNGYSYDYPGTGHATNHPVLEIDWYDAVKFCNARSQMEGRIPAYYADAAMTQAYTNGQMAPYVNWHSGYRLPTESEWEKAARGGAAGHRFPWTDADTISWERANYYSDTNLYAYDLNPIEGYDANFESGSMPYTSPVGSFAPNGYGLYDMAGNAWEWCWDYAGQYPSQWQSDPRGPATDPGSGRVGRGGNWNYYAVDCRNSYRYGNSPTDSASNIGFRCALSIP